MRGWPTFLALFGGGGEGDSDSVRCSPMPAAGAPAIDPLGRFPDPHKSVTIELEGFEPAVFQENEPIWSLVLRAMVLVGSSAFEFAERPEDAVAMFEVISWDAETRLLRVRRK